MLYLNFDKSLKRSNWHNVETFHLLQKVPDSELKENIKQYIAKHLYIQKSDKNAILCCACRQTITDSVQSIEIQGAHQHSYQNPAGIFFNLACFRQAAGCQQHGIATLEYTWFAGFSWRFALCRHCKIHLGWFYQNSTESFYGLIIEQLVFPSE